MGGIGPVRPSIGLLQGGEDLGGQHYHQRRKALSGDLIRSGLRPEKRGGQGHGLRSLHHRRGPAEEAGGHCAQVPGADPAGGNVRSAALQEKCGDEKE